eukprot:CAMPEP_0119316264 /NCGR_PEP_ID=MMETSP1333-20130426/39209_1 /TAXON_ID=418940 /ORGANISM="Scyphosphaera apsteinii, Strain RCC1455" /LENGTH=419 /DNA_ID=CAMNT_0007321865 /DNA_START=143 /DNA_END=1401 /DNA_ORIENTATION=-
MPVLGVSALSMIRMDESMDDAFSSAEVTLQATAAPGLSPCSIKVIGVGGGGGNTINRMVQEGPGIERSTFLEYVAFNTDIQALSASLADTTVQLGKNQARGLGAGGIPSVGRASAIDAAAEVEALVRGVDMVFVTAGMGGGTGSGAAPVVAELAKQAGCLTVGIVTKPFSFEGRRRMQQALEAIDELQQHVDILIVVSNDKLLEIVPEGVPLQEAFSLADEILRQGITGISDIVVKPGLINVDFADVRSVMSNAGPALMGIGRGFGKTRARDAALAAVSSPLLDFPIEKAKGVVFTITGTSDMSLQEVNDVATVISSIVASDANIIFGTSVDETYGDEIAVTVVATSFEVPEQYDHQPISAAAAFASITAKRSASPISATFSPSRTASSSINLGAGAAHDLATSQVLESVLTPVLWVHH